MLRNNTFLPINTKKIEGQDAKFITYRAENESLVGVGFYDVNQRRIASTTIAIPDGQDLSEESILSCVGVSLAANVSQPTAPAPKAPDQAKS